jgi:L-alanine-DL-glutamate epimerase-like enolase superfamily enzyme
MKINRIDTLRLDEFPNLLFVTVHTDEGLVGLGETFFGAQAVEAYLHESVAPYLLGKDPLQIERHATALRGYLGFASTGTEQRGNSAIDVALWDLLGQASGLPLYLLLGGASRDSVPIYNTCAGYRYVRQRPVQAVENWGLRDGEPEGPYEDLEAFLADAGRLAEDLLGQGITGMKIWPFDPYAEASNGTSISAHDLDRGLEPFRKIRAAVGSAMDVMVEFHSLWDVPTAQRILRALEPFEPFWYEDPVRPDSPSALAQVARSTRVRVAAGETVAGRRAFRELLDREAAQVVIVDLSWCGGISEARKIGSLAETYGIPVTPHDCTGPVVLTASTHLSLHLPNAPVQETVRAYYTGWYRDLVTALPTIENGNIRPPESAGLGTSLLPEVHERADAHLRSSTLEHASV